MAKTGTIYVAGVKHNAVFAVNGFNCRCNFGLDDNLTFIIESKRQCLIL